MYANADIKALFLFEWEFSNEQIRSRNKLVYPGGGLTAGGRGSGIQEITQLKEHLINN